MLRPYILIPQSLQKPEAKRHLATATDVLRLLAVLSGANPALRDLAPEALRLFQALDRADHGLPLLVDVHREPALAAGVRYAVVVVNNYAGMPFGLLERAFAGIMLRDDAGGRHFDPRTVELKFALQGENGVFLPLVLDMVEGTLHWLDVHAKGNFEFNNVETSNQAITKICPELMTYFASGVRTSMYDLALLHAAARARRVHIRGKAGEPIHHFLRQPEEDPIAFLARLTGGRSDSQSPAFPSPDGPVFAALFRGNLELPKGSEAYVLFREITAGTIAASDLLT